MLVLVGCLASCGPPRYSVRLWGVGSELGDVACNRSETCWGADTRALDVLEPMCFIEGGSGPRQEVSCSGGEAIIIGPAAPILRVQARCQEDRVDQLARQRTARVLARLPAPRRQRMYVVGDDTRLMAPNRNSPFDITLTESVEIPVNTVVELVRPWPDEDGECSLAMVRVVEAGGHALEGRWGYARRTSLSRASDPDRPSPRGAAQAEVRRERAAVRARIIREVGDAEVARGECDERSHRALETVLHRTTQVFEGMRNPLARHVGHEYVVATDAGVAVAFRPTLRGTYHLFAVALGEVQLTGHDRQGHELSMRSEYELVVMSGVNVASLRILASDFDQSTLSVRGHGCAVVMGFDIIE